MSLVSPFSDQHAAFFTRGWCAFDWDMALAEWVKAALPSAWEAVDNAAYCEWFRHEGTWFVGVNALPNDDLGSVNGVALTGAAVGFIGEVFGINTTSNWAWDRAQVSVCYPGYPARGDGESEGLHRYRVKRDAAHIDGLHGVGAERRRFLKEHHLFVLGIPMNVFDRGASPFVVWEGSHEIVRAAFAEQLRGVKVADWENIDLTDVYHTVRQECFARCERVEVYLQPGESFLMHRLALHGMAAWGDSAAESRMICYFRPEVGLSANWLFAD